MKNSFQLITFIIILLLNCTALNCFKTRSDSNNVVNKHKFETLNKKLYTKNKSYKLNFQKSRKLNPAPSEASKVPEKPINKTNIVEGWLSITSVTLANPDYFPDLTTPAGTQKVFYDQNFSRLNPEYKVGSQDVPYPTAFYFKLNDKYLYYYTNKTSKVLLATMSLVSFKQVSLQIKNTSCFNIIDFKENKWVLCSETDKQALEFICKIQSTLKLELERNCSTKVENFDSHQKIEIRKINQPLIIIPLPSNYCNTNWDYNKNGDNWECLCKDGKEQSPVDLPPKKMAVESEVKPNFEYVIADKIIPKNDAQVNVNKGDTLNVIYEDHSIKIKHPDMGRVVTPEGGIFVAKEIVFHSPSEHLIDGKRQELEMQVIHYGQTVGDIYKRVVLSFLFTSSPGSLNKFFDKMNVYDLPNPLDKSRVIHDNIFIPYVFFKSDEEDMNIMKPFSFYTYNGSVTTPPCNEDVIIYVASDPIPLSNTSITLMKEALRVPDKIDSKGNIQIDNNVYENFRNVKPLNGRAVYLYDKDLYECPDLSSTGNKQKEAENKGHYEKITKKSERYFYVPGFQPSGLPNSILVTDEEANNNS
jgi:carbonic anhydrase